MGPPLHQRSTVSLCPCVLVSLGGPRVVRFNGCMQAISCRRPAAAAGEPAPCLHLLPITLRAATQYCSLVQPPTQPCDIALGGWPPCCQLYQLRFPAWPATADCHSRHKPYPDWAGSDNDPAREQTRLFSRSSCGQGSPGACQASAGCGISGVKATAGARLGARHLCCCCLHFQRSFSLKKSAHG